MSVSSFQTELKALKNKKSSTCFETEQSLQTEVKPPIVKKRRLLSARVTRSTPQNLIKKARA